MSIKVIAIDPNNPIDLLKLLGILEEVAKGDDVNNLTEEQAKLFRGDTTSTIVYSDDVKPGDEPLYTIIETEYVNVPVLVDAPTMTTKLFRSEYEDFNAFVEAQADAVVTHKEIHDKHGIALGRMRMLRRKESELIIH